MRTRYYQNRCLTREARKSGPKVWIFRWREDTPEGRKQRKVIMGTIEEFPNRADAMRACELLRANINRETRSPRSVAELVTHYMANEMPNKTPYTGQVYSGYLQRWIVPAWGDYSPSDVKAVAWKDG
jgi:integrase